MERGYSDCRYGKLDNMDPSEIYPRRINAKKALITQKGEEFMFPFGRTKLLARGYEFREPNPRQEKAVRSESLRGQFQGEQEGLNRQNQKMTLKPGKTSGRLKVTPSIVITMNLEFNSVGRMKKLSLFHWYTLM